MQITYWPIPIPGPTCLSPSPYHLPPPTYHIYLLTFSSVLLHYRIKPFLSISSESTFLPSSMCPNTMTNEIYSCVACFMTYCFYYSMDQFSSSSANVILSTYAFISRCLPLLLSLCLLFMCVKQPSISILSILLLLPTPTIHRYSLLLLT